MKFLIFSLFLPFLLISPPESVIKWETETDYDFGDIIQGQPQSFDFKFTNLTDTPLTVDNVRTTCGCTATDWSEIPTLPDSTGSIHITFDARKSGYFYKKIRVFFHGQRKGEMLTISGYVEPK